MVFYLLSIHLSLILVACNLSNYFIFFVYSPLTFVIYDFYLYLFMYTLYNFLSYRTFCNHFVTFINIYLIFYPLDYFYSQVYTTNILLILMHISDIFFLNLSIHPFTWISSCCLNPFLYIIKRSIYYINGGLLCLKTKNMQTHLKP